MADILNTGTSGYATGAIDTTAVLVDLVTPIAVKHPNGLADAIIQIETILGVGPTLKGSTANLVARLAVGLDSTGKLNLSTDASINGPLNATKGGTGLATLTDGAVLLGSGTGAVTPLALPTANRVLNHSGTGDPTWVTGLLYHGPTAIGAGSTRSLETFSSATGNLSGIHFYDGAFTLNSGHTLTVPAGSGRLVISSNTSIMINGTISAVGGGLLAGGTVVADPGPSNAGNPGTDAPGGGGGAGDYTAGAGGAMLWHGMTVKNGGTAGSNPGSPIAGGAGTGVTGSAHPGLIAWASIYGGASGGAGSNGSLGTGGGIGGYGGASVVLIAPSVTFGASSVITTNGQAGAAGVTTQGTGAGGGGGGGGGSFLVVTKTFTDNGATITTAGGAGGAGGPASVTAGTAGGAGGNGVKQILEYN